MVQMITKIYSEKIEQDSGDSYYCDMNLKTLYEKFRSYRMATVRHIHNHLEFRMRDPLLEIIFSDLKS